MKFMINKKTNVRKAFRGDECVAVFGVAADLLGADVLLDVEKGYEQNVVVIHAPDWNITEHDSIDAAKSAIVKYENLNTLFGTVARAIYPTLDTDKAIRALLLSFRLDDDESERKIKMRCVEHFIKACYLTIQIDTNGRPYCYYLDSDSCIADAYLSGDGSYK